jgi:polysaccharide pyruvyl transferase WcaK-like protein
MSPHSLRPSGACPLRIGLLGMYQSQNLGDTSIQMAVMQALQERFGPIKFLGICSNPHDTVRTHGIAAVESSGNGPLVEPENSRESFSPGISLTRSSAGASRWLPEPLARLCTIDRIAASLDLLIVSGGGQIDDYWGGPWAQPFRLLLWSASARRHRVPVAFMGVGLDELATRLGAWFSVLALRMARFRAFRDSGSLDALQSMGLKAPSIVCPDPAFGLRALPLAIGRKDTPYVVISPIARSAWSGAEGAEYEAYLGLLAAVAERLLEAGLAVCFACSQTRMDPRIVQRVRRKMTAEAATRCTYETIVTVDDFLRVTSSAQLVIASRLHAAILALVAGTPVVEIAYSRKGKQLMSDMHLSEYCIDLGGADADVVTTIVKRALAHGSELRDRIAERCAAYRSLLGSTYDLLGDTVAPAIRSRADAVEARKRA